MGLVWKIDPFFLGNFGIQVMIFHLIWQSITSLPCPINEYVEIVQANWCYKLCSWYWNFRFWRRLIIKYCIILQNYLIVRTINLFLFDPHISCRQGRQYGRRKISKATKIWLTQVWNLLFMAWLSWIMWKNWISWILE